MCLFNLLSILGATAWIPQGVDLYKKYFKKPEIKGRVLSLITSQNAVYKSRSLSHKGIQYILKLSLISINQDFYLNNIKVKIKYSSNTSEGLIFYVGEGYSLKGDNINGIFKIPQDQYLPFVTLIRRNSPTIGYISFIVDKAQFEEFQQINFIFEGIDEQVSEFKIEREQIKEDLCYFDENLLEKKE